jgi:hypothetical protein
VAGWLRSRGKQENNLDVQSNPTGPLTWVQQFGAALQWPVIVGMAFWCGFYVSTLRDRVVKAEKNVSDLITRHMPHLHSALHAMKGQLDTIQALLMRGRQ